MLLPSQLVELRLPIDRTDLGWIPHGVHPPLVLPLVPVFRHGYWSVQIPSVVERQLRIFMDAGLPLPLELLPDLQR